MKIAIMGAGALGGYFGGRLLQDRHQVSFIARGDHLDALRQSGLTIKSPNGDAQLHPVVASEQPADIGPVDYVLFMVKLYDTESAARQFAPLLGPETAVVSFQNGVDSCERIGNCIGAGRVLGGAAYIFADVESPGVIRHSGGPARLVFGEPDGSLSERAERLAQALVNASVDAIRVADINARLWEKFVLLAGVSGVTSLTRLPIGALLENTRSAELFRSAMQETADVGIRQCPELSTDIVDKQWQFASTLPYGMRSSMLDDLERGKRIELEYLSGVVSSLGKQCNVDTPVHDTILRALHPYVHGTPGLSG